MHPIKIPTVTKVLRTLSIRHWNTLKCKDYCKIFFMHNHHNVHLIQHHFEFHMSALLGTSPAELQVLRAFIVMGCNKALVEAHDHYFLLFNISSSISNSILYNAIFAWSSVQGRAVNWSPTNLSQQFNVWFTEYFPQLLLGSIWLWDVEQTLYWSTFTMYER